MYAFNYFEDGSPPELDRHDKEILDSIVEQTPPVYMQGVPEIGSISNDGRLFELHPKSKIEQYFKRKYGEDKALGIMAVGRQVVGNATYELITRGRRESLGELIDKYISPMNSGNAEGYSYGPLSHAKFLLVVAAGNILKGSLHLIASQTYKFLIKPFGDPVDVYRKWVEKNTGRKVTGDHMKHMEVHDHTNTNQENRSPSNVIEVAVINHIPTIHTNNHEVNHEDGFVCRIERENNETRANSR